MAVEDAARLEQSMANNSFNHSRTYDRDMKSALRTMRDQLGKKEDS